MTTGTPVALSEDERRLVLALREIPESPLRDLYTRLVSELTDFVSSPSCAEMQADGAPCTSASAVVRPVSEAGGACSRDCARAFTRADAAPGRRCPGGDTMDIGIPKEARPREHRVALAPSGVRTLVQQGHRVWVESDAGLDAGHPNADYEKAGAEIAYSRDEILGRAELVVTVYAPLARDYALLHKDQVVFGFWALPATRPEDFQALTESGVTAVGIEAIEDDAGHAPVRTSMSEIAGQPRGHPGQQPPAERVRRQGHPPRRGGRACPRPTSSSWGPGSSVGRRRGRRSASAPR